MSLATFLAFVILGCLAVFAVIYDAIALRRGQDTISEGVRKANVITGGMIAWIMAALWMHFFFSTWK